MTGLQFAFVTVCYLSGVIGVLGLIKDDNIGPNLRVLTALLWPAILPVAGWLFLVLRVTRFLLEGSE